MDLSEPKIVMNERWLYFIHRVVGIFRIILFRWVIIVVYVFYV